MEISVTPISIFCGSDEVGSFEVITNIVTPQTPLLHNNQNEYYRFLGRIQSCGDHQVCLAWTQVANFNSFIICKTKYNKTGNLRITWHWDALCRQYCCWKTIRITYSECVTAVLGAVSSMQYACAIFSSVACPALQYFPHYLINGSIAKSYWT